MIYLISKVGFWYFADLFF